MNAADALAEIQRLATQRRIIVTTHAQIRMVERGVGRLDVYSAIFGATRCEADELPKWKVTGPDTEGEDLRLIIVIEHDAVIVTIF